MITHAFHRYICSQREGWLTLSNLETKLLRKKLEATPIIAPVYITGLARSGTTIMLELLAGLPGIVAHTYRDFPLLITPYFLRKFYHFFDALTPGELKKKERPHKDRIMMTHKSPESMEEVLWMSFFRKLHDESKSNVLSEVTSLPKFESFYLTHIAKLLLVEKARRYVSKANYNVTRIRYLHKLLPDAKFLLLIRDPVSHIASLMKQEKLFLEAQAKDPTAVGHMELSGHFEFGGGRKLINTGDAEAMTAIQLAFAEGKDALGWALYWNSIYAYLLIVLNNPLLRDNLMVVHYEELCADAPKVLRETLNFCQLAADADQLQKMADGISEPDYYKPSLSEEEIATIRRATQDTYHAYDSFRRLSKNS